MIHDDFCLTPDADPCVVCDLIKRVRFDERDAIDGEREMDIEDIKTIAYDRGYKEGKSSVKPIEKSPVIQTKMDLDSIKDYIMRRAPHAPLAETNGLYALYTYLGGK